MNELQNQAEYQAGAAAPSFPAPAKKGPSLALIIIINAVLSIAIAFGVSFLWQNFFSSSGTKITELEKQVLKNTDDIKVIGDRTKFIKSAK